MIRRRFGEWLGRGTRWTLVAMGAIAVMSAVACGGRQARDADAPARGGGEVELEGTISSRGNMPFPMTLLEIEGGETYLLESSAIVDELRMLQGMHVFVFGRILPEVLGGTPAVRVEDYELLRLPSGERPIVGTIRGGNEETVDARVWLFGERDEKWVIAGDFESVLAGFAGAKVWVVGVTGQSLRIGTIAYRTLLVTEYGVIRY